MDPFHPGIFGVRVSFPIYGYLGSYTLILELEVFDSFRIFCVSSFDTKGDDFKIKTSNQMKTRLNLLLSKVIKTPLPKHSTIVRVVNIPYYHVKMKDKLPLPKRRDNCTEINVFPSGSCPKDVIIVRENVKKKSFPLPCILPCE